MFKMQVCNMVCKLHEHCQPCQQSILSAILSAILQLINKVNMTGQKLL